jgi:hypothetical protein
MRDMRDRQERTVDVDARPRLAKELRPVDGHDEDPDRPSITRLNHEVLAPAKRDQ